MSRGGGGKIPVTRAASNLQHDRCRNALISKGGGTNINHFHGRFVIVPGFRRGRTVSELRRECVDVRLNPPPPPFFLIEVPSLLETRRSYHLMSGRCTLSWERPRKVGSGEEQ